MPTAIPQPVAATPTKPAPGQLHPAIAAAAILAGAMAIYLGTAAAMDTAQTIRLGNLETENAALRAQATAAKAAKQAYCQGGAQ